MKLNRYKNTTEDTSYGIIPVHKMGDRFLFLLIRNFDIDGKTPGHWSFPKGHAEEGESEIEAAKREFSEETGIEEVEITEEPVFFENYKFKADGQKIVKTVKYFIGLVEDTVVREQKDEVCDYQWAEYEEAMELMTFDEGRNILKKAYEHVDIVYGS